MSSVVHLWILSSAAALVAFDIAETELFSGIRKEARRASPRLGKLLSCAHCIAHWVALALVLAAPPSLYWGAPWALSDAVALLVNAAVVAYLASIQAMLLCWLMDQAGK